MVEKLMILILKIVGILVAMWVTRRILVVEIVIIVLHFTTKKVNNFTNFAN
jgi:hypothetical protein